MSPTPLWENKRWRVVLPERLLTPGHLAIIDRAPSEDIDLAGGAGLIDAYRTVRSALWCALGYRGFMISFAVDWQPDRDAIGEPDPIDGNSCAIHVFGRGAADDRLSPVRVMAARQRDRRYETVDKGKVAALKVALTSAPDVDVPGPADRDCDGCWPEVLTKQERWRADGVRVIRPRGVMIDAQVMLLPLRHVVSLGDLLAEEVASMFARLGEVGRQFAMASGVTGLSCFANDGTAAHQETPHVHLHVFGRSRREGANPFELLGRRLPPSVSANNA